MVVYIIIIATQSYNIEKDIEGSGINDVIQHNNNILTL